MSSVRIFAQALCRQSCARAPAARLRGGTGPSMLRCEAPAPVLHTTRGHLQAVSGNLKIGASLCCCCWCWWCCCWCRCCCWCGSALRLDSPRASWASDAAGGVAGGSDRGSTVEVEAGGSGGPLSLFNGRVRGLGGQPGGRGFNQATEDRGPSRGAARPEGELGRSGWSHPVGGTEASGTLHSTLSS